MAESLFTGLKYFWFMEEERILWADAIYTHKVWIQIQIRASTQ
jgi:hypothetical protein